MEGYSYRDWDAFLDGLGPLVELVTKVFNVHSSLGHERRIQGDIVREQRYKIITLIHGQLISLSGPFSATTVRQYLAQGWSQWWGRRGLSRWNVHPQAAYHLRCSARHST